MIKKEYLVNPSTWLDFKGLIFTHHERYYLSIEKDKQLYLDLFNKKWTLRKLTIDKDGNKTYKHKDITEDNAKALMPEIINNSLKYNEFRFPVQSKCADSRLQVYSGNLNHLMLLKVKLEDENQAQNFIPPSYCLCEVTDDPYFSQLSLSSKDYIHIQKHVNRCYKGKITPSDFFEQ